MSITIKKADKTDKNIIKNLMQLYQYDFTDFGGEHLAEDGAFHYKYLDSYWLEPDRYPYVIYYKEKIAGFCFVNKHSLLKESNVHVIAEFFILKYLRGKKVGFEAAKNIIKQYQGKWEISQTKQNIGAQEFWLEVVKDLRGNSYKKTIIDGEQKIVLSFDLK